LAEGGGGILKGGRGVRREIGLEKEAGASNGQLELKDEKERKTRFSCSESSSMKRQMKVSTWGSMKNGGGAGLA